MLSGSMRRLVHRAPPTTVAQPAHFKMLFSKIHPMINDYEPQDDHRNRHVGNSDDSPHHMLQ
jgi:hypothetical protein